MNKQQFHGWQAIETELKRRISDRVWRPGEQVPNEVDLAEEFGCARATVNRAMQQLADAGLVDRKRKSGTLVTLNPVRKATLEIPIIREEVEARGMKWHHAVLGRKIARATKQVSARYKLPEETRLLHLRSLHFADRMPFVHESRWINLARAPEAETGNFEEISVNEWLVQNAPFTRGDIAFSAMSASATEAEALAVEKGSAVFTVERTTFQDDSPVTSVKLVYAPGYKMQTIL